MKSSHFIVAFGCMFIQPGFSQAWIPQGIGLLPYGYEVNSISVVQDSVIWVSASLKEASSYPVKLFRSVDAGLHWAINDIDACEQCKCRQIEAIDATTAWLTIYDQTGAGKLFKTTDGGQNWELKLSDPAAGNGIIVYDSLHISARNGLHFALSEDGGETWESDILSDIPLSHYPASVASTILGDTAWLGIAGAQFYSYELINAKLLRTTEYGSNDHLMDSGLDSVAALDFVSFSDGHHGLMRYIKWAPTLDWDLYPAFTWKEQHQLARTTDGGTSWSVLPTLLNNIRSISTVPGSPQTFIVTGENQYYVTTNAGETWNSGPVPYPHCCLDFSSPISGWMGINGTSADHPLVLKWNGGLLSGKRAYYGISRMEINIFPNPGKEIIRFDLGIGSSDLHTITVTNVAGQIVIQKQTDQQEINIAQLPEGMYFIIVHSKERTGSAKILKY